MIYGRTMNMAMYQHLQGGRDVAKHIIKQIVFIILTLFGVFMIYGEIVIRLFRGTELLGKAYNIYYLIPIRAHMPVALGSFLFVVYLLSQVTKKRTLKKLVLLIIYVIYIVLYLNTLRGM